MGEKVLREMSVFGSLWRSSSSAQPGSYAASSSRSGFFLERSFSETNRTLSFYQPFRQTSEKYLFFNGNYLNGKTLNLHLGGLGGQRIHNIWSNKPGFFSGASGSLSEGTSGSSKSSWDSSEVAKKFRNIPEGRSKFPCSQGWGQPEWWPPVQPTLHLHPPVIKIQPASRLFAADKPEFRNKWKEKKAPNREKLVSGAAAILPFGIRWHLEFHPWFVPLLQ